jgi:UDP-galactopyranose mutase
MAERLASELGQRVLVVDKRGHIAGNAYDAENGSGIRVHRYGAHIFHTKSDTVWNYLARFTEWLDYVHKVRSLVDGKLVPMPCNLDTMQALLGHSRRDIEVLIETLGFGARVPVLCLLEHPNPTLRAAGLQIYNKLFVGYTVKQWGTSPEMLDRSVTGRVPVVLSHDDRYFVDSHQGIPADGYARMVERMLSHPRITVELGCNYRSLADRYRGLPTVYTGPIDEFFQYAHGPLPYRSLRFEHRTFGLDRVQPVAVINYPNDMSYTRVIEHAHFADQHLGTSTLTYEYPEAHEPGANEPYYPVPRPKSHRQFAQYSADAARLDGKVFFVGRLAEYKYYDMDQAVAHALAAFEHKILKRPGAAEELQYRRRLADQRANLTPV